MVPIDANCSVVVMISLLQEAILVNCSRGPVIDEAALVEHLRQNPMFRVGLDVFEVIERSNFLCSLSRSCIPSLFMKFRTCHYKTTFVNFY